MTPLVSVITPTYNCGSFIRETVTSVINQDYPNIEYIVLDDGSTDNTRELLSHYGGKLTYIYHENMGEHHTINKGLRMVRGKYFMYPNADDPLLPGAITRLVKAMEDNPAALCAYPDWQTINEDNTVRATIRRDYDFEYMIRHHTCLPSVGCMFRSSLIEKVGFRDPSFRWVSDFDYWLRIGLVGSMVRVPIVLAQWRHRAGQGSGQKSDIRAQEHIRIMDKFYMNRIAQLNYHHLEHEARCWSYLVAAAVTDSKKALLRYVARAIRQYPVLSVKFEFYHALYQHANYILRR